MGRGRMGFRAALIMRMTVAVGMIVAGMIVTFVPMVFSRFMIMFGGVLRRFGIGLS